MSKMTCPVCHKSIGITKEPGVEYCECRSLTITLVLTDYLVEILRSISRQLQPAKTEVPQVFYDALGDEEVSL
jgi:hypothetical protein